MSEDQAIGKSIGTAAAGGNVRMPFGCSLFLLDFIAVVYIITHWSQVSVQIARLIQMIP